MPALQDIVKRGTTSWRGARLFCFSSTTFLPKSDVAYNSSGIDLWYQRQGAAKTSITEATLAAADSAYSSGGFIHVSDGHYRLDLPDAALASSAGVNFVDFGGTVTGGVFVGGRIRLTDLDLDDSVRAGLTALPNAAADAAGGLPISDAGGLDMDDLKADVTAILADTGTDGVVLAADAITAAKIADNAFANEHFAAGALTSAEITSAAGITLADDAITSAKFDESTAYPLKSADTGATAVLRTGADSDTGETLSDQMDALATSSALATVDGIVDTLLALMTNKRGIRKESSTWYLYVRNAADDGDILKKALKDKDGNEITDIAAGAIAAELASSV